jgi:hypothetical protein
LKMHYPMKQMARVLSLQLASHYYSIKQHTY